MKTNHFSLGVIFSLFFHFFFMGAIAKNQVIMDETWISAGDMIYPRLDHTATLLQNGKVLIVGWNSNIAELYDPTNQSYTATGSTALNHRQGLTATLLNDGRVLITGGLNAQTSAEIYDPDTGLFSSTGSYSAFRCYHSATLLSDGRVLIVGGQNQVGPQTHAVVEIYDPTTGQFSPTDSLNVDRSSHTATLLPDGQVLITGGLQTTTPGNANFIASCEIYNPATETFRLIQSLKQPRANHAATRLADGRVLISGGAWYASHGEIYDVTTGQWTTTGDMMVTKRSSHTATRLPDGRVLLAGGFIQAASSSSEIYNPASNTFELADSMITPRMQHTATLLTDGSVIVTGGYDGNGAIKQTERIWIDTTDTVSVDDEKSENLKARKSFVLSQNYPNPFNSETQMNYRIASPADVRISVYNMRGERMRTLIRSYHEVGQYAMSWDGRSENGIIVGAGVYLVRMEAGTWNECRKIVFLK